MNNSDLNSSDVKNTYEIFKKWFDGESVDINVILIFTIELIDHVNLNVNKSLEEKKQVCSVILEKIISESKLSTSRKNDLVSFSVKSLPYLFDRIIVSQNQNQNQNNKQNNYKELNHSTNQNVNQNININQNINPKSSSDFDLKLRRRLLTSDSDSDKNLSIKLDKIKTVQFDTRGRSCCFSSCMIDTDEI